MNTRYSHLRDAGENGNVPCGDYHTVFGGMSFSIKRVSSPVLITALFGNLGQMTKQLVRNGNFLSGMCLTHIGSPLLAKGFALATSVGFGQLGSQFGVRSAGNPGTSYLC